MDNHRLSLFMISTPLPQELQHCLCLLHGKCRKSFINFFAIFTFRIYFENKKSFIYFENDKNFIDIFLKMIKSFIIKKTKKHQQCLQGGALGQCVCIYVVFPVHTA